MYIDAIKKAVRISHDKLDDDLLRIEEFACAELIRVGVPESIILGGTNSLIQNAIITRVLMEYGPEKSYDNAKESWEYQLDNLRKHDWTVKTDV